MNKIKIARLTKLNKVMNNVKDNRYGFYEMWRRHHYFLLKGMKNPFCNELTKSHKYIKLLN